MSVAKKGTFTL